MNRTANATESRFSEPTIISPAAVVIERPINRFTNTAKMIFGECNAIQRMNSTTITVPIPLTIAPSWTVENSSLAIGTGPVSRTRAPYSPARLRSLAACLMASVASFPGSSALKSRIGLNSMKARRSASVKGLSLTSSRQENVPEPVFNTFSTVWAISENGRSVESSLICPRLTPASPVSSAPVKPRMLGSPAMISISGAADSNCPVSRPTSAVGRNNNPFFSKNSPEPSGWTDAKCLLSPDNFCASAAPAAPVSSGVGASTTARIVLSRSKAFSNWLSRWRQSSF